MSPSHTPRKFAPVPIEETTKSSKQLPASTGNEPKVRRFAPEPIEQTVKSSKDAPQPALETEKPKPKRFAPEIVEQTTKSSKSARHQAPEQNEKPKPRRFAPQLVDESEKSSKDKSEPEKTQHVKFKPEPIATTYGSRRKPKRQEDHTSSKVAGEGSQKKPPRKFKPILLDTATRSRRAGDPNAPISQDYRTEYGYHAHPHEHWRRVQGERTPTVGSEADMDDVADDDDQLSPTSSDQSLQRRQLSPLDGSAPTRTRCLIPKRQHSFRTPELDTIESSESEDDSIASSVPPTPRHEGSPVAVKGSFELFEHATKRRESIDDDWQHYLLDLERKKAQQRLEEQAMAAYPNIDFGYEHPHHYFNDDDDVDEFEIEDRPVTWDGNDDDLLEMTRRESAVNLPLEQRELQRHAEEIQQERNANKTTAKQPEQSPFMKDFGLVDMATDELKSMRERARPPMLGKDIVFPRCASPDPARFDVTQGSTALRNQMCYLTAAAEHEKKKSGQEGGLWGAPKAANKSPVDTAKSPVVAVQSPVSAKSPSTKGLWGGFCVNDGEVSSASGTVAAYPQPTGLMTPKQEKPDPFQLSLTEGRPVGLMTPEKMPGKKLRHRTDLEQLNAKLVTEREIDAMMEHEYPDAFITQVYNYLSLGYPSIARDFDDELSKISRMPISELRQDDEKAKATPRGYIRLGPDFEGGGGDGMTEDSCMRWQALKRYVREWARQEKNMVKSDLVGGNWGTGARRGSWAI